MPSTAAPTSELINCKKFTKLNKKLINRSIILFPRFSSRENREEKGCQESREEEERICNHTHRRTKNRNPWFVINTSFSSLCLSRRLQNSLGSCDCNLAGDKEELLRSTKHTIR